MTFGTVTLNDGYECPTIAFGTGSALYLKDATKYVEQAIEVGFTHIDSSAVYDNEDSIARAIKQLGTERSNLYITTKYDGGDIQAAMTNSLGKLGIKYADLYLVHSPSHLEDFARAWKEFENIKEDGLAKSIGVSNFKLDQLQTIVEFAKIKPAVNQIQFHPYNYAEHKSLLDYSTKHGIVTEAYGSLIPIRKYLGGPVDKPVAEAAKRIGASNVQVLMKWARAKGAILVTTSCKQEHLEECLAVEDLDELTEDEVAAIDKAGSEGPPETIISA